MENHDSASAGPLEEGLRVYLPIRRSPNIVCIGGGHGLSAMLRGLKRYTKKLTAIVTVADDGGGSGMLRRDLDMPPPGDIRNCILALANTEALMERLLNYRFSDGSLAGQSFGNLFLAAMHGISNSFDEAVHRMGDVLAITGRVLPVTNSNVQLEAEFENGTKVLGESKIFYHKKENDCRITKVRLLPERPRALEESLEAIRRADLIVLGPGSLYTSIIPNFLVDGIPEAVASSKALRVLVMNIMTQEGETEGYTGPDHLRALLAHGAAVDCCLANGTPPSQALLDAYAAEDAGPVELREDELEAMGVKVRVFPLLAAGTVARHNPDALARALLNTYETWGS